MKIYKFCQWLNHTKTIIREKQIYFASVDNYKFCSYEFRENFTSDFVETFGVFSCSRNYNNHTLWCDFAHYNSGVCLEFEFNQAFLDANFIHNHVTYLPNDQLKGKLTSSNNLYDLFLIDDKLCKETEYRIIRTNLTDRSFRFPKNSLKKIILGIDFPEKQLIELKELLSNFSPEYLKIVYKIINNPYQSGVSDYLMPQESLVL
jgi:hypothetical protein